MVNSAQLLRMLEPTVRPGNVSKPEVGGASQPLEQKSFEMLLAEARTSDADLTQEMDAGHAEGVGQVSDAAKAAGDAADAGRRGGADLLKPLSHVGAIDNASLRQIVAGQ